MINSGFVLPTWGHLEQYSNLHVSKPYVKPTLLVVVARLPYLFGPFSSGLKTEGSTFETICGGRKILGWKWEWNRWACGIPWMWMWMRVSERPSRKWMIVCQLVLWDVASVRGTASEQSLWGRVKWIFERGERERWFGFSPWLGSLRGLGIFFRPSQVWFLGERERLRLFQSLCFSLSSSKSSDFVQKTDFLKLKRVED